MIQVQIKQKNAGLLLSVGPTKTILKNTPITMKSQHYQLTGRNDDQLLDFSYRFRLSFNFIQNCAFSYQEMNLMKYCVKSNFSVLQTTNYPYIFGGIPKKSENSYLKPFLTKIFDPNVIDGFQLGYKAILSSLEYKDKELLQQTLEPGLLRNISFHEVKNVNPTNQLSVSITKIYLALGGKFIRTGSESFQKIRQHNGIHFYLNSSLMNSMTVNPMSMKLSLIFGTEIYFEGNNKVIMNNQTNSDSIQVHSAQFQIENQLNMQQVFQVMGNMGHNGGQSLQSVQKMRALIIGSNYQWKVVDIDGVLNGNLV